MLCLMPLFLLNELTKYNRMIRLRLCIREVVSVVCAVRNTENIYIHILNAAHTQNNSTSSSIVFVNVCVCARMSTMAHMRIIIESQHQFQYIDLSHMYCI